MKGMNDLMRQAQLMQNKLAKIQEEAGEREVEGTSGGGMVKIGCKGKLELTSVKIDKAVVNPEDVEMLEDLVLTAVNEALRQAREMMDREMSVITGGMKLPGMF